MTLAPSPAHLTLLSQEGVTALFQERHDVPPRRRANAEHPRRIVARETLLKRLCLIGSLAPTAQLSFVVARVQGLDALAWQPAAESLQTFADRVMGLTRATDVVGRYTDSSFGVVLQGTGPSAASAVAARLQYHLGQLAEATRPLSVVVAVATGTGVNARALPEAVLDSLRDCG
jgi:hypothetical protein